MRRWTRWRRGLRYYLGSVGPRGLLVAAKGRVLGKTSTMVVQSDEVAHPITLRVPSSDVPAYFEIFVRHEYQFSATKRPEVIVDAGANVGLASVYFANRYPEARILAIEPEHGNFEMLCRNVAPYPEVTPVQAALWHHVGEIDLEDPGLGSWAFRARPEETPEEGSGRSAEQGSQGGAALVHRVEAVTVPELLRRYRLERIDILKIDIEGAEKEVFSDTTGWIDKVDALIVELHERMKPGCNRSFYNGSNGFDEEWRQGENLYLSRKGCITRRS